MWDLIVSVPDHCLSCYFVGHGVSTGLDNVSYGNKKTSSVDLSACV